MIYNITALQQNIYKRINAKRQEGGSSYTHKDFLKGGKQRMKTAQFIGICLYYYGREAAQNPAYMLMVLSLFFITHKVASWAAWAISL